MGGEQSKAEPERKLDLTAAERRELDHLRKELEDRLKLGLKPVVTPTSQERETAKARHKYEDGKYHIAIAGVSGTGKSSFINAVRGLRSNPDDPLVAPTGVAETTTDAHRYADPNPDGTRPYVWYDIPGAGTLEVADWEYFNNQGLYIFDCIIVLFDTRFFATDIAILKHCAHFGIPSFIVRSKSQIHIQNIIEETLEYAAEEDDIDGEGMRREARTRYILDTNVSVAYNLGRAGLRLQPVFCVDRTKLLRLVRGQQAPGAIDEVKLLRTMHATVQKKMNPSGDQPAPPYSQ
ncbi:hypothetical protein WOLCODRAFT_160924 [Wolfiporia cocos MD-104 SS10]|uniref:IRG-type G domain-containing protein n=1 Tax=Wolfiporia cocos (strain MD-104) TaxID=742152 RepID=A0A2H3JCW0_WOLCO|nr:hypothetical protein WOLCODRAFT_160924 [Wolfiporia cocos MD-104 SS10]